MLSITLPYPGGFHYAELRHRSSPKLPQEVGKHWAGSSSDDLAVRAVTLAYCNTEQETAAISVHNILLAGSTMVTVHLASEASEWADASHTDCLMM